MDLRTFVDSDSLFMRMTYKFNLLVGINVLVLLCCIPIVTAGAALTSMHDYLFHLHENTEGALLKSFIVSFKQNFKQSTAVWMLFLGMFVVAAIDVIIFMNAGAEFPFILKILFIEMFILSLGTFCYSFPVIANFTGTVRETLKNSFFLAAGMVKKTVMIMTLYLLPWLVLSIFPMLGWIVLLIGISGPSYIAVCLYHKEFKQIKERIWRQTKKKN